MVPKQPRLSAEQKVRAIRELAYELIQLAALCPALPEAEATAKVCHSFLTITDGSGT